MPKQLFNFYLDDTDKHAAEAKLFELLGPQTKGQLAALIRVLIKDFINTPTSNVSPDLVNKINNEYTYSLVKNKRSSL